jgi:hypothetical protein
MRRLFFSSVCLGLILGTAAQAQVPNRARNLPGPQPQSDPVSSGGAETAQDRGRRGRGHHDHDHGHHHQHHGHHHHHWPWFWLPPIYVAPFPVDYFGYNLPGLYDPTPIVPPQQPAAVASAPLDPTSQQPFKTTNAEQKARAGRFLQYGDDNFAKQKYLAALGRYKTAISTAPDLADSYLRQGFAYVALGQFDSAAKAFRRGLTVQSNWRGSALQLDALYGHGAIVKEQHLEELAKAVEDNPLDADLLLTLGMELYFDGQRDRAELCFARAVQLGADSQLLIDFLPQPKPAGAADAPARGKISF